jgi:competence protein ComEA
VSRERFQSLALVFVALLAVAILGAMAWRRTRQIEPVFVIEGRPDPPISSAVPAQPASLPNRSPRQKPQTELVVHVAGEVKKPGVYRLAPGSRNEDAVKAAGGPLEKADLDGINLAQPVEDGVQLLVPEKGAAAPQREFATRAARGGSGKLTRPGEGTVNINTATATDLQRLPGVGPSTAAKILAYRKEAGRFAAPDQLMEVSGIGEKKFAAMQPFVRVR